MSSGGLAEAGVSNPVNNHESAPSTTSPQTSERQPAPAQETVAAVPATSDGPANTSPAAVESEHAPSGDAAAANHPATGGESGFPRTAATTTTSSRPADNTDAVVSLPTSDAPEMDATEPKSPEDPSSDPSDDSQGKEVDDTGPSLVITLLLTTGARHPFTIDRKYLRKQPVNVEDYDPFAMSIYTLKELIWREWRTDWESRPSSPSSIRLIFFGKLLDDKSALSDLRFSRDAPNVVHMTVKPQEIVDEEDAKGVKTQFSREREPNERSPGCRCVIL